MKETKVICPNCGAEIAIANNEHIVKNATVIGKDSGLGTVALPLAKKGNKAEDRLEALKAAGIDTSNLFAMRSAKGDEMLVKQENGHLHIIDDDDPMFRVIYSGGTIPERSLFRRWVMSQMFHMLAATDYRGHYRIGYTEALHRKGYEYQWKMTEEELRVQARLHVNDIENFELRNRWFNRAVADHLCATYIQELEAYLKKLQVRKCKGVPYVRVKGKNIFVEDLRVKIINPLRMARASMTVAKTPQNLWMAFHKFNALRVQLPWCTKQDTEWVNAFKGSGAYFTMKNLILFHGCKVKGDNGMFYSQIPSLSILEHRAEEYSKDRDGWRMLAMLKKFLDDNNVDIEAKMREWRKK